MESASQFTRQERKGRMAAMLALGLLAGMESRARSMPGMWTAAVRCGFFCPSVAHFTAPEGFSHMALSLSITDVPQIRTVQNEVMKHIPLQHVLKTAG